MSAGTGAVRGPKSDFLKGREALVMPTILFALAVIVAVGITLASHFRGTPFPTSFYIGLGSSSPFFFVSLLQLTSNRCAKKED